jgi:hypothetical protein
MEGVETPKILHNVRQIHACILHSYSQEYSTRDWLLSPGTCVPHTIQLELRFTDNGTVLVVCSSVLEYCSSKEYSTTLNWQKAESLLEYAI